MANTAKNMLHEAAIEGNITMLLELLQQDPLLVNLNDHDETPLHVAVLLGHVRFVDEILKRRPQLAKELDSRRSSALHLAAAKGLVEILTRLLQVDANMCLWCDADGRNPLHLAAMRGHVDVLAKLLEARPAAARTAVDGGTVLAKLLEYLACNTAGFTTSLIVMLMLITGLPFKHPVVVWILILAMWVAVASMAATYGKAIKFLTPVV